MRSVILVCGAILGAANGTIAAEVLDEPAPLFQALSPAEWTRVDEAANRALAWLGRHQQKDGSFPTIGSAQPAVTSLCVLAFLSCGHQPGVGPYGKQIDLAIDFVLSCQQPSGLLCFEKPASTHQHNQASHTASYNHAIGGLMLTEVFGQITGERSVQVGRAVESALRMTQRLQVEPAKQHRADEGGWRYLRKYGGRSDSNSDLSVTAWHLMFLRSAKNAEFRVPDQTVAAAMRYVERCFDPKAGIFYYGLIGTDRYTSRGMMGAGILSLSLGGKHQTEMALRAGDWLLARPFDRYGAHVGGRGDRFHYSAYYCSQAMAQLGGRYWKSFFPPLVKTMLQSQARDGSWESESSYDGIFGSAYPTALTVLALTPPHQVLPVYQR